MQDGRAKSYALWPAAEPIHPEGATNYRRPSCSFRLLRPQDSFPCGRFVFQVEIDCGGVFFARAPVRALPFAPDQYSTLPVVNPTFSAAGTAHLVLLSLS